MGENETMINTPVVGSVDYLIDLIVITVGQCRVFGIEEYEMQFELLMKRLQKKLGMDMESTIKYVEKYVEQEVAA